jgi:hypothetical protein
MDPCACSWSQAGGSYIAGRGRAVSVIILRGDARKLPLHRRTRESG